MLNRNHHPALHQLLLFADGELSPRHARWVRSHLTTCCECRSKLAEIETAMEEIVQLHRQVLDARVPPADGPRAELRARMAEWAANSQPGYAWQSLLTPGVMRFAVVCAVTLIAVLGAALLYRNTVRNRENLRSFVGPLPNPSLTPGVTKSIAMSSICSAPEDEVDVPVTGNLQKKVFQEYGISGTSAANYEVDYLISPGLGGADDIRNLWPEPRYDVAWNSFVKDQLENYLHHEVCVGRIKLSVAQREISGNWIAAYKKYFHTDRPLSTHQAEASPVPDASARIDGVESKLAMPQWGPFSGFLSYSWQESTGQGPITGGLFIGSEDVAGVASNSSFWTSQDQRNTAHASFHYRVTRRLWLVTEEHYGSGLPVEFNSGDVNHNFRLAEYGPKILSEVDFARGRVRPSYSIELGAGFYIYDKENKRVRLQVQGSNLTNHL